MPIKAGIGHLIIAKHARDQLNLEKVIFVPAFIPPHKVTGISATPPERLTMAKLAVKGNRSFSVSPVEFKRQGISYTVDTVKAIQGQYPNAELFLIVGSDNEVQFESWKSPKEISLMATLAVYERRGIPGIEEPTAPRTVSIRLKGHWLDISSSAIRLRMTEGKSIRYLVPPAVEQFIMKHKLYHRPFLAK